MSVCDIVGIGNREKFGMGWGGVSRESQVAKQRVSDIYTDGLYYSKILRQFSRVSGNCA